MYNLRIIVNRRFKMTALIRTLIKILNNLQITFLSCCYICSITKFYCSLLVFRCNFQCSTFWKTHWRLPLLQSLQAVTSPCRLLLVSQIYPYLKRGFHGVYITKMAQRYFFSFVGRTGYIFFLINIALYQAEWDVGDMWKRLGRN